MTDIDVPVLVAGGGGCGLATSVFLSDAGVRHLVVERRESTSMLPRAHYLNQRTMELFRQHGFAGDVYRIGCPLPNMSEVVWRTSLAGDDPLDAQDLYRIDSFGGRSTAGPYAADSPCPSTNLPQHRLEPLLLKQARDRAPDSVLFGHVLEKFHQDGDGVTAWITDRATGDSHTVRARYLLGADGGRTVGAALDVPMDGDGGGFTIVSVHFAADFSQYWPGDSVLMTHFVSPHGGQLTTSAIVAAGPSWGLACEEWAMHFRVPPGTELDLGRESVSARIRELLRLPDELELKIRRIGEYGPEAVVARAFQVGRVFLLGDAAHRQPPATGLGLNTAIHDAHNLAWKLGAVVDGRAGEALLDTYEAERLPIARRNVSWSMASLRNHGVLYSTLGLMPGQPEATKASFTQLLSDTPIGETRRTVLRKVFATQRVEYQAHDIELGAYYEAGAVLPDGTAPPPRDPMGATYHPSTRPGHRLPHVWLNHGEKRVSSLDLAGRHGGHVLITGPLGEGWTVAAKKVADAYRVPLTVVPVGGKPDAADYWDAEGAWAAVRGIDDDGAVLVRPDNHVAWRSATASERPDEDLDTVFRQLFGHAARVGAES